MAKRPKPDADGSDLVRVVDPSERPVYWFWVTDPELEALRRGDVLPSVQASAVTLLQWKGDDPSTA